MRQLFVIACLLCVITVKSYGQPVSALPNSIRASETLDNINELSSGEMLYGIPMPEGKVIGDTYLSTNWMKSTLLLYDQDKILKGYPVRYDIQLDELEIKGKDGVKVVKGDRVKSFSLVDSLLNRPKYFVNAKEYKNTDNITLSGFFQVLADGPLPLFKKTSIQIKEADYRVQFDVGSRDNKILKKDGYFTLEGKNVIELPSSKKKLLPFFGEKATEIDKFIKLNSLILSNEGHLKAVFEHYNALVQR